MQIKFNDVNYKNLNLNFQIEDNKITGIVSNNITNLYDINYIIKNDIKDSGNIKYFGRYSKNKIGLISMNNTYDIIDGIFSDYINLKKINNEYLSILNIDEKIIKRRVVDLSTSEKIKLIILKCLADNPDVILVENILEELDCQMRKKIIKLLINLKKFEKKTIIITSVDVDIIYEFIDNLILIINNKSIQSNDKYSIYDENGLIFNKPFVKEICDMVYSKSNINLGNNDNINELIKAIYREIR